ncbi:MAG: PQQ-binding-like beta-propeller repeat protein, partial [Thermoanaerobaculia bacterium]|nr:PQQ-binding-like beta-propeller repeat protein [Thermoanaerobaculia bacterium]
MGRVVAIDGTGSGDITATKELWRVNELTAGFPSPVIKDGILYIVDNSANLHAYDSKTGAELWSYSLGTVGKGSPVWADGKLYATETNGNFHILKPSREGVEKLDHDFITMPAGDRHAEIYGSPAIAYGRIFFTTEEGIYCLGDGSKPFKAEPGPVLELAQEPP